MKVQPFHSVLLLHSRKLSVTSNLSSGRVIVRRLQLAAGRSTLAESDQAFALSIPRESFLSHVPRLKYGIAVDVETSAIRIALQYRAVQERSLIEGASQSVAVFLRELRYRKGTSAAAYRRGLFQKGTRCAARFHLPTFRSS